MVHSSLLPQQKHDCCGCTGAITDTELGDAFLIYTRTGETRKDLSMFLVEKGTPGFSLGQRIKDKYAAHSLQQPFLRVALCGLGVYYSDTSVRSRVCCRCGMRASGTAELVFQGIEAAGVWLSLSALVCRLRRARNQPGG